MRPFTTDELAMAGGVHFGAMVVAIISFILGDVWKLARIVWACPPIKVRVPPTDIARDVI